MVVSEQARESKRSERNIRQTCTLSIGQYVEKCITGLHGYQVDHGVAAHTSHRWFYAFDQKEP